MPCAICKTAKPRRFCEALRENICTACCGAGREETIDCTLTCEYLAEAHRYERKPPQDRAALPGKDVTIDDDFLGANGFLILLLGKAMFDAVRLYPHATDADAADALDSLARTWRTLIAGLYYETRPVNPIATSMFDAVKAAVESTRTRIRERDATRSLPDTAILGALVFFQRSHFVLNNGRRKCKAFLVFLSQFHTDEKVLKQELEAARSAPLVVL